MPFVPSPLPSPSHRRRDSVGQMRPPPSPYKVDDRFALRPPPPSPNWSIYPQPFTPVTPRRPSIPLPAPALSAITNVPQVTLAPAPARRVRARTSDAPPIGPFQFLRVLPGGSFGATHITRDHGSGRVLCTRVFSKKSMATDNLLSDGLLTELLCYRRIAARPAHDRAFLMEMHAALQDDARIVFAMPLMQCDLLAVIHGRGDKRRTRRWVAQVARGIDALHAMGVIHRDVKPENLLLDAASDTVRIADFNAAYVDPAGGALERRAVYAREYIGSKPYMAQEVVERRWYGRAVDWWALGCVLFDLTMGELLFRSDQQRTKYVGWDRKTEGMSYLAWAGDLTDVEESVLAGLIHLSPAKRFDMADLRRHPYFVDERGVNVLDAVQEEALRPRAAARLARDTYEVSAALKDTPLCHATPHPPRTAAAAAAETHNFCAIGWVNPRGLWGTA
ncbi:kinase-like domain-containing protein [Amylocystis lapponica]|nr:kinase-like domain-containing protein [Amylocystis lapponica]